MLNLQEYLVESWREKGCTKKDLERTSDYELLLRWHEFIMYLSQDYERAMIEMKDARSILLEEHD